MSLTRPSWDAQLFLVLRTGDPLRVNERLSLGRPQLAETGPSANGSFQPIADIALFKQMARLDIRQLRSKGAVLNPGKYDTDNMIVVPVREQLVGMAKIHRQLNDLPEGTSVQTKVTD